MKSFSLAFLAALGGVALAQPGVTQPATPPPVSPGTPPPGTAPSPVLPQPIDPLAAQTNSTGGEVLTLERAIEIAMRQQPSLRQSQAALEAARGRADLARVARNPTVVLDATAGASSGFSTSGTGARVASPDFFSHQESTGLGATANWRIYDFGQTTASIRAAELNADAFAATIGTTTLDIRTNVEVAYLTAVADRKLVVVAETTVKSEDTHLDQARRFVAAQAHDPIEVAQAQARAANARSALAQSQSNEAIALANLRSAIGWLDPARSPTVAPNWPVPPETEPAALTALVDTARKNRPEILQLDKLLEAAGANLDAAHAERRPVLSASAQTQWSPGTGNWSPQPNWSAGLSLSFPLFDGGRASADIRIANANVLSASANRDALLITLTSQLDAARSEIVANHANVAASTEAVAAARAQLQLSEARYTQGLGSQIELADAQTAVTTAEGNLVQAEFQLASAWAQLHRAVAQQ
ncbi:MAG TPA: TolC family protein [Kofleriaceae bacterium]|jgi:outer membrane protein|nr:TolC family protein [Kofleriaceae bacterium]